MTLEHGGTTLEHHGTIPEHEGTTLPPLSMTARTTLKHDGTTLEHDMIYVLHLAKSCTRRIVVE